MQTPIIFTKAAESVIGPGEPIQYPHGVSSELDYEAGRAFARCFPSLGSREQLQQGAHLTRLQDDKPRLA